MTGLFDYLKAVNPANELLGFTAGTRGLFDRATLTLTRETLAAFRNQGGFHLLGRSVDKIRTEADHAAALGAADALKLDGLVLLGGTFTNTDAGACMGMRGRQLWCDGCAWDGVSWRTEAGGNGGESRREVV